MLEMWATVQGQGNIESRLVEVGAGGAPAAVHGEWGEIHWIMVPVPISRGPFFPFSETIIWYYLDLLDLCGFFISERPAKDSMPDLTCLTWRVSVSFSKIPTRRSGQLHGEEDANRQLQAKISPWSGFWIKHLWIWKLEKVWKIKWFSGAILGYS